MVFGSRLGLSLRARIYLAAREHGRLIARRFHPSSSNVAEMKESFSKSIIRAQGFLESASTDVIYRAYGLGGEGGRRPVMQASVYQQPTPQ